MADTDTIDDYELLNCIATGSATQIWEVRKTGSTQSLAMKILLPEAFKDAEQKGSLKHEANVAKSLEHPNIIRLMETKFTRKHGYFIMEHFRGGNLKSLIRNDHAPVKAKAKRLIECLSQAVAYMHDKKWIHRDIKPDNVLLTKGGDIRLIDFSLSSRAGNPIAHAMTRKKSIVIAGTRTYLAPELIRREVLTPSVDIYSLGILFFEILVGHPPFRHGNPNELLVMHVRDTAPPPSMYDSNITPEGDKMVAKMLAKFPKDRHSSMQEVYSEIRNLNLFHEDPMEHYKAKMKAFASSDAQTQNDRLDSRKDAERTATGEPRPAPKPKAKPKVVLPPEPVAPAKEPQPAAAAAMVPPQAMPFPGMPGQFGPFPGMPMPGYPMHPGMYPQAGMHPQAGMPMPGMPMPGYPMMQPGMPMPGMQMPGYPMMQPGMPMPQMPVPGAPFPSGVSQMPGAAAPIPQQVPQAIPQLTPPTSSAPVKLSPEPQNDAPLASIDDLEIE